MRTTTLDALPAVAARQDGVFTREQALAGGWTPAQVGHRISTGRWVRLAGRALVRAGAAVPPEGRAWAVHRTWPRRWAAGFGTWGNRRLAQLLAATADGALSQGERLLHAALRRAGLTVWVANATIEFDGWAAHGNHAALVADRRRQNALVALGYTVLRVTWADLVEREATVIAQICAALVR